jgi:hypothetical protein
LDAACLPALARIGMTALPPDLRARVERLDEADEDAAVVRAQVRLMAGLMAPPLLNDLEGCQHG